MRYSIYDLGTVPKGHAVEIILEKASNVRLMTQENFTAFTERRKHDLMGGYVTYAPYIIRVPKTAHWCAVIDTDKQGNQIKASIFVHRGDKKLRGNTVDLQ